MESKLFGQILMVAQFIPIPIVQVAVRVANIARAAYSVYQGVKHGSLAMVAGGIAGAVGGAGALGKMAGATGKSSQNGRMGGREGNFGQTQLGVHLRGVMYLPARRRGTPLLPSRNVAGTSETPLP